MSHLQADIDRFYTILRGLESTAQQGQPLASYTGRSNIPSRGVYFFREPSEFRSSTPTTQRIVRVGTHAVSIHAKSTLWQRLRTHLGTRSGGGNHRGSIFRLHVGAALIAKDQANCATWGRGSTRPPELSQSHEASAAEAGWEKAVSKYIGAMTILWVDVPDEPGSNSERADIERNSIALLSNHLSPIERPTDKWLGTFSPREEIRQSGLWNLNHVAQQYVPAFLDRLQDAVERTMS